MEHPQTFAEELYMHFPTPKLKSIKENISIPPASFDFSLRTPFAIAETLPEGVKIFKILSASP